MSLKETNVAMNFYTGLAGIIIILIISIVLLTLYAQRDEISYIKYDETADIDYKVNLKENDYFEEEYLIKDKQYIASIIDDINANFKYKLDLEEKLKYSYKYKILANINVLDVDTNKVVYTQSENLVEEKIGTRDDILEINENVTIDFSKYNDLITQFVSGYNLRNVTSFINVEMYMGIAGEDKKFDSEKVILTLKIPLTTTTVAMDVKSDLDGNVDRLIAFKPNYTKSKIFLIVAIALIIIDGFLTYLLVKYVKSSETEESKYRKQLRRIMNNYGTYISKVDDEFDMTKYTVLKVREFVDLLEIRDTIHAPIIMLENEKKLVTCFVVPTNNQILYFYSIGVKVYALPKSTVNVNTKDSTVNSKGEGKDEQKV